MIINPDTVAFHIGDPVRLRVDPSDVGIVTGILFRPTAIIYYVSFGQRGESMHYDIELIPGEFPTVFVTPS